MYIDQADPTIKNCTFTNNHAERDGEGGGTPTPDDPDTPDGEAGSPCGATGGTRTFDAAGGK